MLNCEKDFGSQRQQFYSISVATLHSSSEALIELHMKGEGGFNHSSSYQHIKGIKSNFFETPCHFDFYQSGTVKTEENKSVKN
jgi:hypothetical protein